MVNCEEESQWESTVIYQTKRILFTVFWANDHLAIWLRLLSDLGWKLEAKTSASGCMILSLYLRQKILWRIWESREQSPRKDSVAATNKVPVCILSAGGAYGGLYHTPFCAARGSSFILLPLEWDRDLDNSPCAVNFTTPGKWFPSLFSLAGVGEGTVTSWPPEFGTNWGNKRVARSHVPYELCS